VTGRICNECRALFWNLQASNRAGCEECNCHIPGTVGGIGICDSKTGQCVCKPSVHSRRCEECMDGTYDLEENSVFGCRGKTNLIF
jgi:laminin alpha 3/5